MRHDPIKIGIVIFLIMIVVFFGGREACNFINGDNYRIVKKEGSYLVEEKTFTGWENRNAFPTIESAVRYIHSKKDEKKPLNVEAELRKEKQAMAASGTIYLSGTSSAPLGGGYYGKDNR
jgi:hypothetical protein